MNLLSKMGFDTITFKASDSVLRTEIYNRMRHSNAAVSQEILIILNGLPENALKRVVRSPRGQGWKSEDGGAQVLTLEDPLLIRFALRLETHSSVARANVKLHVKRYQTMPKRMLIITPPLVAWTKTLARCAMPACCLSPINYTNDTHTCT